MIVGGEGGRMWWNSCRLRCRAGMARCSWWSSVLRFIMEECIKLSEEVVDGRAGGGGHLSVRV